MRNLYTLILSFAISLSASAQSTYSKIYSTFQTSCTFSGCHNHNDAANGLDLEGSGATLTDKQNAVYNNIYNTAPTNSYAAAAGYKRIMPGDPYRSFLFRKAHGSIAQDEIKLDAQEGDPMPDHGVPLDAVDAERIRQWILFGAPIGKNVMDDTLITRYYNGQGLRAIATVPAAPAVGKGFQVHLGPFFLPPNTGGSGTSSETEWFTKYATQLPKETEIIKVEPHTGNGYSHHLIVYKYQPGDDKYKPFGFRHDNAHVYCDVVSVHQDDRVLQLPEYTAFDWEANTYLDFDTHYINYSTTKVLACDVYVNIYTQPAGVARQLMYTLAVPDTAIHIPNDGKLYSFTEPVFMSLDTKLYVWAMGSHTHQYGKGFQIFKRNLDGSKGDMVYDGMCPNGIPGCTAGYYDFEHPPVRFWDTLMPISSKAGFIQTAYYKNTGSVPVKWGDKSTDEMMVMAIMYVLDTTGLEIKKDTTTIHTGMADAVDAAEEFEIYPNPMQQYSTLSIPEGIHEQVLFTMYDINGRELFHYPIPAGARQLRIERQALKPGMYLYHIQHGNTIINGKLAVE